MNEIEKILVDEIKDYKDIHSLDAPNGILDFSREIKESNKILDHIKSQSKEIERLKELAERIVEQKEYIHVHYTLRKTSVFSAINELEQLLTKPE